MTQTIITRPLAQAEFADFGDVLEVRGDADKAINQGRCLRYHDKAELDFSTGRGGISIFDAQPESMPFTMKMMERHPDGSQAVLPMHQNSYLVVVAPDEHGEPGTPAAFIAAPGQGVNYHRNIWHGVLSPLSAPGLFAVVDRIGDGANLEEHWFDTPWLVELGQ